ncbi:MAG: hypothetical protein HXX15_15745 [Rhodopseudomonas sp.]|uniref:DUF6968 family protein n=1 Tax=Rhodopseudomonas sp. TaxID=1078 RepID=UPI00182F45A7|nr:hypothetical protein [Rhodopseudomonas sp.]NVN87529.1 hypothetical protein [Rhodopseudomonas sp.]
MIIATRILKIASDTENIDVPVTIFAPERADPDWICRFEIGWTSEPQQKYAVGIDPIQALLFAMQMIGAELYASDQHESGRLIWLERGKGYGFPVPASIRDLLQGDDARFL